MKKITVFSLLLAVLAITASCGGTSRRNEISVFAPADLTVKSGNATTLNFSCNHTEVAFNTITNVTLTKVDIPCSIRFLSTTPGRYTVSAYALEDASKFASVVVSVVPNFQIALTPSSVVDGNVITRILPTQPTVNVTATTTPANWTLKWSVSSYDSANPIGEFADETVGQFTTKKVGGGVLMATLTQPPPDPPEIGFVPLVTTASLAVTVVPDIYIDGPEMVVAAPDAETPGTPERYAVGGSIAANTDLYPAPPTLASMSAIEWAGVAPGTYPALDELGIPMGAYIYPATVVEYDPGMLAFNMFVPIAVTQIPIPGNIAGGYTPINAEAIPTMTPVQWAVYEYEEENPWYAFGMGLESVTYNYVVLAPPSNVKWTVTSDNDELYIGSINPWGYFTPGHYNVKGVVSASIPDDSDIMAGDSLSASLAMQVGAASGGGKPAELEGLTPIGASDGSEAPWSETAKYNDPTLTTTLEGVIPDNAYVYGSFAATPIPSAIKGYVLVSGLTDLGPGKWTSFDVNGYSYMAIIPAYTRPAELEGLTPIGASDGSEAPWSETAKYNDPTLTTTLEGVVPDEAYVYGSFAATPIPSAINGYGIVSGLTDLGPGKWTPFDVNGYSYMAIVPSGRW